MARGRLISKTLGTASKRFVALAADLGPLGEFAQALFLLLIASTDDFGRHDGDSYTVKHSVWPTSHRSDGDFETALSGMARVGLLTRYEVDDRMYLQINNFDEHQPGLHKRRSSKFPEPPGNSRQFPEIPSEGKGSEGKVREEEVKAPAVLTPQPPPQPIFGRRNPDLMTYGPVKLWASQFRDEIVPLVATHFGGDRDAANTPAREWIGELDAANQARTPSGDAVLQPAKWWSAQAAQRWATGTAVVDRGVENILRGLAEAEARDAARKAARS